MYSSNQLTPKTPQQARIWNLFNNNAPGQRRLQNSDDTTWDFIEMKYWPRQWAEPALQQKLDYKSRFALFCYLVGNGLTPEKAGDAILKMGERYFDKAAKDHVAALTKDVYKNDGKWTYWDEMQARIMELYIPKEEKRKPRKVVEPPYPKIDRSLQSDMNRNFLRKTKREKGDWWLWE